LHEKLIRRILACFFLIFAILVFVATVAVRNVSRSVAASDWVNHTQAVILEVQEILSAAQAGDAALRTYVMTGEARDLADSRDAFARLSEHVEVARALTRLEPGPHRQIVRLAALADGRAAFAREAQTARQSAGPESARALLTADPEASALGEIRRGVERLKSEQMALLAERDRAAYLQAQATRWTVWSGVAINFLLLGGAAWLIRDDIATRRRLARTLEEANAQLERRVRERTAELTAANAQLSTDLLERRWSNQALEHQLRYNEHIVNSINDLVFVLTKAMKISRINPAVVHLTGFEAPELIDLPLSRVVHLPADQQKPATPPIDRLARALKDGHDLRNLAAVVTNKGGHTLPARLTLVPLRDQDKVVGGVAILQVSGDGSSAPDPSQNS